MVMLVVVVAVLLLLRGQTFVVNGDRSIVLHALHDHVVILVVFVCVHDLVLWHELRHRHIYHLERFWAMLNPEAYLVSGPAIFEERGLSASNKAHLSSPSPAHTPRLSLLRSFNSTPPPFG